MIPPMTWTTGPRSAMPRASSRTGPPASRIPISDQRDRDARQRPPGRFGRDLELDRHLVGEDRPSARGSCCRGPAGARRRRAGRRSGLGDGWVVARAWISMCDLDRLPVALVALGRGVALGGDPLGLARLLEHAPSLGEDRVGLGAAVAGGGQRVAVAFELGQRQFALLERQPWPARRPARRP